MNAKALKTGIRYFSQLTKPKKFYQRAHLVNNTYTQEDHIKNTQWLKGDKANYTRSNLNSFRNFSLVKETGDQYFQIKLDKKLLKTQNLDPMYIPNKLLAISLLDEWQSQHEFIDRYSMHFNKYFSMGTRLYYDPDLLGSIIEKIPPFFTSDQVNFIDEEQSEFFKANKKVDFKDALERVCKYIKGEFDILLKTSSNFDYIDGEGENCVRAVDLNEANENESKIIKVLKTYDPLIVSVLDCLCGITKSFCVSVCLINDVISIDEAYYLSQFEEILQKEVNGEVEGYHDLLHEDVLGKLESAYCYVKLLKGI